MIGAFLSKQSALVLGGLGLTCLAALFGWLALHVVAGMVADARSAAIGETDAKWKAEIAAANLKVAQAELVRANETMRLNSELAEARETARLAQDELEKANVALPDGDRNGLDIGRVRLLNRR